MLTSAVIINDGDITIFILFR